MTFKFCHQVFALENIFFEMWLQKDFSSKDLPRTNRYEFIIKEKIMNIMDILNLN